MRLSLVLAPLTLGAATVSAAEFSCQGVAPSWSLVFDQAQARFVFPGPTEMDVMLETPAEGEADGWPRAYTLVGARDTAIVLIEREDCGPASAPYRAHVMTQRGQTPILLTGCCRAAE